MMEDVDALVAGGGLSGSIVALELARAGRRVALVEKSKGAHDKVCGEFLSRESLHYLRRHGIDPKALGGVPIASVRLIAEGFAVEKALPFEAFSLTRRRLDEEMLRCVSDAGAAVYRGVAVERMERVERDWVAHLQDGQTLRATDAFLATGKHDLRGWARPPGTQGNLVAFKMYYRLTGNQQAELGQAVELILFAGGYAGLQPVEEGAANLCLLVTAERLKQAGANWAGLLEYLLRESPHLKRRLEGAVPLLGTPLAASHIPYGHMQRSGEDGLWRVGDQAAVIPSFCGDGMAIALHSGALAAVEFLHGRSAPMYQRRLHGQISRRLWMATKLSQALVSLPKVTHLVRAFPMLLPSIALMTRIPDRALIPGSVRGD